MAHVLHRGPIVDTATGPVALLRTTAEGLGGADLLTVRNAVVEPIWSVTGDRAFRY